MKTLGIFIYTPSLSSNRRGTGAFWRGHKMYATITIKPNSTIFKAADHMQYTLNSGDKHCASRACRADGDVMDNKWYFSRNNEAYYVIDRDVADVDIASVSIKKQGEPTRKLKRTF